MSDYSIVHAFLGVSYVAKGDASSESPAMPEILRLKKDDAKEAFLLNLSPEDRFFIEMGGAGDKVTLIAMYRGAEVRRIPSFKLGDKDAVKGVLEARGWLMPDEPSIGSETSDHLTARRNRAVALFARAASCPGDFALIGEANQPILLIKQRMRSYRAYQRTLLATYQRLLATFKDQYLLEGVKSGEATGTVMGDKVTTEAAMRAINAMLVSIPENERGAFLAKMGVDKLVGKSAIPRKAVVDMLQKIIDALMESDILSPFLASMKSEKKEIEKLLKNDPVYQLVFDPIPGCGPLISGRIMAAIVDIRGFRTRPQLTAFAGYHHFADGSRARRVAGRVSNWNPEFKQAVYLWTEQTLKLPSSPWRARLDLRRAYELYKILKDRQLKAFEQDLDVEILPQAFEARVIRSVNDMTVADLAILLAHVDVLRKKAGVRTGDDEEDDLEADSTPDPTAKDPKLAKLLRGLKAQAMQKAKRWLGQQLLKHIFQEWRKAIGLPERPEDEPSAAPPEAKGDASEAHASL